MMAKALWLTLNMRLMPVLPRANSSNSEEPTATTAAHHAPKSSALAMWIMNDVDPLAATRRRVWRPSSSVATKSNVAMGHQPGKSRRTDHATVPEAQDTITMVATKRRSLVSRDIELRDGDPDL